MSTQPPLPAGDARQPDALDVFLDGIANGGQTVPPGDLEPTLAATVRHVHGLADQSLSTDLDRAGKAHRWEDLMRTNAARPTIRPFPTTATLPPSSTPSPILLRPVPRQSRLRRLGGQSLGLVATLTLVLLVAASSMAVYLTAPQGAHEPTEVLAAFGASPTAEASTTTANPRVTMFPCEVAPMSFDDVMTILARSVGPPDGGDPKVMAPQVGLPLPTGDDPNQALVDTVTTLLGRYLGCEQSVLRRGTMSTDAGIVRFFSPRDFNGLEPLNGYIIVLAWQERASDNLSASQATGPSPYVMGNLRILRDGRIAGYLSREYSLAADGTLSVGMDGYVVFAQENGQWLIDEFQPEPYP